MRTVIFLTLLAGLALTPVGLGSPVGGPRALKERIDAGPGDAPGQLFFKVPCRGGERMCVTAIGDHDPEVPMSIIVYDKNRQVVVQDKGSEGVPDIVGVIWYPPRDEEYQVEVRSYGRVENKVFIAVR